MMSSTLVGLLPALSPRRGGRGLSGRTNLGRIDAGPIHVQCDLDRLPFGLRCQYVAVTPGRSGAKTAAREGNGRLFCSPLHILERYPDRAALFALVVEQKTTGLSDAVQPKGERSLARGRSPTAPKRLTGRSQRAANPRDSRRPVGPGSGGVRRPSPSTEDDRAL